MHFHTFGVVVEGKADLTDGGRLLVFGCIDNEALKEGFFFDFTFRTFLIDDGVDVWLHFHNFINTIADCVYLFIDPHFSEFAFRVILEIEVLKLQSLFLIFWMEVKLGVIVAGIQHMIAFKLMFPLNSWFRIFFFQILKAVVYELAMIIFEPHAAEQFGLSEVVNLFSTDLCIQCGTPLFVGFQVNQPYFMIVSVPYHNLLGTDHLNRNQPTTFTFHFLSEYGLSVGVSVKKEYAKRSNVLNVLLSSLLLRQKHECVVEGSEHIINICVFLSKVDENCFFVKHQLNQLNIYDKQEINFHKYRR